MGTEIRITFLFHLDLLRLGVKLNNPLMGTEIKICL